MNFRNRKKLFFIPFGIAACLALISYVVMLLWNWLLPQLLHVPTVDYWQAMGIFVLSKILFGFGGKGGPGSAPWMRRKQMMEERMRNMTPEERTQFKQQWKDRCSNWGRKGFDWNKPAADKTNEQYTPDK